MQATRPSESSTHLYVALNKLGGAAFRQTGPLGVGIYAHVDRLQALAYGSHLGVTRITEGKLLRLSTLSDEDRDLLIKGLHAEDKSVAERLASIDACGILDDVYSHGSVFVLKPEALAPARPESNSITPGDPALPFIGYVAADGTFEAYDEHVAAAADYHHSVVIKDLDAYEAPDTISFVRMGSSPNFTLRGEALVDPHSRTSAAKIGALCSRLIELGADPDAHVLVEDMGFTRAEAPYQGRNIGTLALWSSKDPAQAEAHRNAEELRRWFGASRLVDQDGRPVLFYRGEPSGVLPERFRIEDTHLHTGFFFSESPEVAKFHAAKTGASGELAVDSYHLNAVRVLDLTAEALPPADYSFVTTYFAEYDEWIDRTSGDEVNPWDFIQSGTLYSYEGGGTPSRWLHLFRMARANGYDGVRVHDTTEVEPSTTLVVFNPEQIRSTTRHLSGHPPARADLMMRLADPLGSEGFTRWCDGAELADAHSFEARNGHPVVLRLFHGTLGDFDRFDLSKSNEEAFLGRAVYASSCAHDASVNYASRNGPDPRQKAEDVWDHLADSGELSGNDEEDQELLRQTFGAHDGLLMPVYVKLIKPAVIMKDGGTFIPYEPDDDGLTQSPFEQLINHMRRSENIIPLTRDEFKECIEDLCQAALEQDGIYLIDVVFTLRRRGLGSTYGETARGHLLADFLAEMGYDGIIDYDPQRFGGWVPDDAVHVMAFEPRSVKSALGNRGTFDPESDSILERLDGPGHGLSPVAARLALRRHFGPGIDAMITTGRLRLADGAHGLPDDIPQAIQDAAIAGRLKGLADRGNHVVTLNPRAMRDASELITSFYHEVGEHLGLENLLGRRGYRRLIATVKREAPHSPALQAGIRRLAFEQPGLRPAHPHYWPEVIAYAGESAGARKEGWWGQIRRGINTWLIKHDLLPRKLNDTDLQDLLHASAKAQLQSAMSMAVTRDRATFELIGRGMPGPTREPELAQANHAGIGLGLLR